MSFLDRTGAPRPVITAGDGILNAVVTVASLISAVFFTGLLASFVLMHLAHDSSTLGTIIYGVLIVWTLGFGICGLLIVSYRSWHAWQRREPPIWR